LASAILEPRGLTREPVRPWMTIALLVSAAMLAAAHAFETFGGYAPCILCLRQREIYWVAMGVAGATLLLSLIWPRARTSRVPLVILGLVFLIGAIVAAYHAGAEWKFWPGPAECAAGKLPSFNSADLLEALSKKGHPPSCEEAAWRLAGISMAGYNFLVSLALAGATFFVAARRRPEPEEQP
jgi:disulfide bond formation protein DsbB